MVGINLLPRASTPRGVAGRRPRRRQEGFLRSTRRLIQTSAAPPATSTAPSSLPRDSITDSRKAASTRPSAAAHPGRVQQGHGITPPRSCAPSWTSSPNQAPTFLDAGKLARQLDALAIRDRNERSSRPPASCAPRCARPPPSQTTSAPPSFAQGRELEELHRESGNPTGTVLNRQSAKTAKRRTRWPRYLSRERHGARTFRSRLPAVDIEFGPGSIGRANGTRKRSGDLALGESSTAAHLVSLWRSWRFGRVQHAADAPNDNAASQSVAHPPRSAARARSGRERVGALPEGQGAGRVGVAIVEAVEDGQGVQGDCPDVGLEQKLEPGSRTV